MGVESAVFKRYSIPGNGRSVCALPYIERAEAWYSRTRPSKPYARHILPPPNPKAVVRCFAIVALWMPFVPSLRAQTDEIQVYDAAIAPLGAFNLTVHNNFTPSGSSAPAFPGAVVPDRSLNGVAEWAY